MKSALLALLPALACAAPPFEPTLESLTRRDPAPEWFRDAKVGIYFHWGVYSVPAFGNEWYPCNMFNKGSRENRHHIATWGDPAKFGYHDFIPLFKAERFDAAEWADLFAAAGARFAGPVAEHHDNFAMWDSKVHRWNAAAMGPRRDLTGELARAIRARGMKLVTTFHHEKCGIRVDGPGRVAGHYAGVKQHYPQLLEDPQLRRFYGDIPREEFLKLWLDKLIEVIDAYQPDLIWHDAWMDEIPASVVYTYLAHYFNRAREWGREVVVTVKGRDLPRKLAVEDFEKGRADDLTEHAWLTDDTISKGSWCFTDDLQIKDADEVIDTLVDIVSKNGQLLLNISPRADGTIPDDQRKVLLAMGDWLKANGEAVYATRPWLAYGEGPTRMGKGGHFVGEVRYGPADVRYTRSKDGSTLYATVLGTPTGPLTLTRVAAKPGPTARVELLASGAAARYSLDPRGRLVIEPPALPDAPAHAFRLTGFELALAPLPVEVTATAAQATLDGTALRLEEKGGRQCVGFWDDPAESVHWLVRFPAPGVYQIELDAAALQPSRVTLAGAGQSLAAPVPPTGDWGRPQPAPLGRLRVDNAGIAHLALRAAEPAGWRAVNVFGLRATRADE